MRVHVCGASTKRRRQVLVAWAPRRWRLWQRSQLRRRVVVAVGVVAFLTHCLHLQAGKAKTARASVMSTPWPRQHFKALQCGITQRESKQMDTWCTDRRGTRNATVGQALQARECACCVLSLKKQGTRSLGERLCVGVRLMRSKRWKVENCVSPETIWRRSSSARSFSRLCSTSTLAATSSSCPPTHRPTCDWQRAERTESPVLSACAQSLRDSHSIIVVALVSAPSFVETVVRTRSEGESELQQTTVRQVGGERVSVTTSHHTNRASSTVGRLCWSRQANNTDIATHTHARTRTDTRAHAQHALTHIGVAERCARGGVRESRAPRERQPLFFDDSQNTHTHHPTTKQNWHTHTKAVEQTLPTMAHEMLPLDSGGKRASTRSRPLRPSPMLTSLLPATGVSDQHAVGPDGVRQLNTVRT